MKVIMIILRMVMILNVLMIRMSMILIIAQDTHCSCSDPLGAIAQHDPTNENPYRRNEDLCCGDDDGADDVDDHEVPLN